MEKFSNYCSRQAVTEGNGKTPDGIQQCKSAVGILAEATDGTKDYDCAMEIITTRCEEMIPQTELRITGDGIGLSLFLDLPELLHAIAEHNLLVSQ